MLVIAIILASAVRPLISRLVRFRVPEVAATLLVIGTIIATLLVLTVSMFAPILNQFADYLDADWRLANRLIVASSWIASNFSQITGQPVQLFDPESIREAVSNLVNSLRTTAPELVYDIGGLVGEAVLVLVMSLYWLTSREKALAFLTRVVTPEVRGRLMNAITEIEQTLGAYTRGVVFVATFVGLLNLLILVVLQVPNAGTYAFIIGMATVLPVVGGLVGGSLATLLALLGSPLHGLIVFGSFVVVQQIEAYVLSPRVMSRSIGLDPLLILVAFLSDSRCMG